MTCPNCGQAFEGSRCPHCGRPATSAPSRIAAVLVLVLLVLPAALFGACSVIGLLGSISDGVDLLGLLLFLAFSAVGFGVAYWAIQKVKELWG